MSKDIYLDSFSDLQVSDTDVFKGANILNVQRGRLYYAQATGIDLARFITPDVSIQTQTFLSYAIQQLLQQGVRVENTVEISEKFIASVVMDIAEPEHTGEL